MVLTLVLLFCSFVVLFKTRFGLRLVSCGEHPQAADSVGINVYKMRYAGVLISGFCGGIGGIIYISAVNSQWDFIYGVAGAGFLALAVMIFGQWHPVKIALAALLFGVFRAVADTYSSFDFLVKLVPGEAYKMLPYMISLVVLAFTSKKSRAPKAEGIPYDKSVR
jgi:simple sugar transport system permease protein